MADDAVIQLGVVVDAAARFPLVERFDATEQLAGGPGHLVDGSLVTTPPSDVTSFVWLARATPGGDGPYGDPVATRARLAELDRIDDGVAHVFRLLIRVQAGAAPALTADALFAGAREIAPRIELQSARESVLSNGTDLSRGAARFWRIAG